MTYAGKLLILLSLFGPLSPAAQAQSSTSCACADGRELAPGDLMRQTQPDNFVDPDKEWRGFQNWNMVRSIHGRIAKVSRVGNTCTGVLVHETYVKDGQKLSPSPVETAVDNLCELVRVEDTSRNTQDTSKSRMRLKDLEESGELEQALRGAPARAGAPSSPYPQALGPFTPGQAVYSLQDGHDASRGQFGIILGASKDGKLVEVGFYCKRVSVMAGIAGLGVGAIVAAAAGHAHKTCARNVPYTQLGLTTDQPPARGAP